MSILVDMDGVIANLELQFLNDWMAKYPFRIAIPLEQRTHFNLETDYSKEYSSDIYDIIHAKGFFRCMPVIEGSVSSLKEMLEMDLDPVICTSPLSDSTTCAMEKMEFIEEHLGSDWIRRVIISKDKTMIKGSHLIDDIVHTGRHTPSWKHMLFNQPYNANTTGDFTRIDWNSWKNHIQKV